MLDLIIWIAIEIVIIYLIIIVIVSARVNFATDDPHLYTPVDPINIQTGDILGVGYRHFFGWFVTGWSGSVWSHTGIAWRHPKTQQLYVLEAAIYNANQRGRDGAWRGVFRIPFDKWMRINHRHYRCHLKLRGEIPPDFTQRLDDIFTQFEHCRLDSFNANWYRFLQRRPYVEEPSRVYYTCYEITIAVLQKVGVFQKEYACSSYFANNIVNRDIPTETNYYYEPAIGITENNIPA